MATFVGHILGSAVVYEAVNRICPSTLPTGKWRLMIPGILGIAPDFDIFAAIILQNIIKISHRGITHSILFIIMLAVLVTVVFRMKNYSHLRILFITAFMCGCMHLFLDFLMSRGPPLPFLFPLDQVKIRCPVQLIPTAYYNLSLTGLINHLFYPKTWLGMTLESLELAPLLFLTLKKRSRQMTWMVIFLSCTGISLTVWMYN